MACPDPFVYYPSTGHCYVVSPTWLNFDGAADYCMNLYPGAHMIDIQTQAEQDVASSLACTKYDIIIAYLIIALS